MPQFLDRSKSSIVYPHRNLIALCDRASLRLNIPPLQNEKITSASSHWYVTVQGIDWGHHRLIKYRPAQMWQRRIETMQLFNKSSQREEEEKEEEARRTWWNVIQSTTWLTKLNVHTSLTWAPAPCLFITLICRDIALIGCSIIHNGKSFSWSSAFIKTQHKKKCPYISCTSNQATQAKKKKTSAGSWAPV